MCSVLTFEMYALVFKIVIRNFYYNSKLTCYYALIIALVSGVVMNTAYCSAHGTDAVQLIRSSPTRASETKY